MWLEVVLSALNEVLKFYYLAGSKHELFRVVRNRKTYSSRLSSTKRNETENLGLRKSGSVFTFRTYLKKRKLCDLGTLHFTRN